MRVVLIGLGVVVACGCSTADPGPTPADELAAAAASGLRNRLPGTWRGETASGDRRDVVLVVDDETFTLRMHGSARPHESTWVVVSAHGDSLQIRATDDDGVARSSTIVFDGSDRFRMTVEEDGAAVELVFRRVVG